MCFACIGVPMCIACAAKKSGCQLDATEIFEPETRKNERKQTNIATDTTNETKLTAWKTTTITLFQVECVRVCVCLHVVRFYLTLSPTQYCR